MEAIVYFQLDTRVLLSREKTAKMTCESIIDTCIGPVGLGIEATICKRFTESVRKAGFRVSTRIKKHSKLEPSIFLLKSRREAVHGKV